MDVERHSRKCKICHHPEREAIEEAYLDWRRPSTIVQEFQIGYAATLYLHANATGLAAKRRRNMNSALDLMIEQAGAIRPTANAIIKAIMVGSQMDENGVYIEPVRRTEVTYANEKGE